MPSSAHEVLVELFRRRPSWAAELLVGMFGVELPAYGQARLEPGDCVDLAPTEYRADAVVLLSDDSGPVRAVVVEVQLRRNDDKRWTWLVYLATLRARLRCGATLLVVCVDQTTARWAATPIETGHPGWVLVPLVVGPDRVPVLDDPVAAAEVPELAVLSALAHGRDPARAAVLDALAGALGAVETEQALLYLRLVLAALPEAARTHLEALMTTGTFEYQSEFTKRLRSEGAAAGRVEAKVGAVLRVLHVRGIPVPDEARARITACTDPDQLDTWHDRAITATSVADLDS